MNTEIDHTCGTICNMSPNISVYDNFFEEEIQNEIWEKMMRPKWSFTGGGTINRFWHMDGLEKEKYFSEYLYEIICKKLDKRFTSIGRIYANGQTAGQNGSIHSDDGETTFLYYANLEWKIQYLGHLMFIDLENDEIIKTVSYKPNRAVLFPANIKHFAQAPNSKFFNDVRVSLAYKFYM